MGFGVGYGEHEEDGDVAATRQVDECCNEQHKVAYMLCILNLGILKYTLKCLLDSTYHRAATICYYI